MQKKKNAIAIKFKKTMEEIDFSICCESSSYIIMYRCIWKNENIVEKYIFPVI